MKELINSWLINQDYEIGREIYNRFGDSTYLKSLFASGPDPYNVKKLHQCLENLAEADPQPQKHTHKPVFQPEAPKQPLPSEEPTAPSEITQAITARKLLFADIRSAHNRLVENYKSGIKTGPENKKLALGILDDWDAMAPLWRLTNHYDQHREIPKPVKLEIDYAQFSVLELNAKWMTNYKYLKKHHQKKDKAETCTARIEECGHIKAALDLQSAFAYPNHTLPTI